MEDEHEEAEFYKEEHELREVTKSHYIPATDRDECQNCGIPFHYPSLRRPHHCRRCGEVFCRPCLQYRRRLNIHAQPDAEGIPCKVCLKCFEERLLIPGCTTRSLTDEFKLLRYHAKEERRKLICDITIEQKNASIVPALWREQFQVDVLKECLRLLDGFQSAVGSSEALKTLHELKDLVNVPSWQKSMFWTLEKSAMACRNCAGKLGKRKKLRNCRVCGLALCKNCSHKELLVYIEDGMKVRANAASRIAVIKKAGSPEVEPKYSLLMCVCTECKTYISDRQIMDPDWFIKKPKSPDMMSQLLTMDECFRDLKEDITNQIEQLEHNQDTGETSTVEKNGAVFSLIQAIHRIEIDDSLDKVKRKLSLKEQTRRKLDEYFILYTKLKSLPSEHKTSLNASQIRILRNYIKGKNAFYLEMNNIFSKLRNEQEQSDDY